MNYKEKIDKLSAYIFANTKIKILKAEIDRLTENIDSIKSSANVSGMPIGSGISDKTSDMAVKLADTRNEYQRILAESEDVRRETMQLVLQARGKQSEVLYMRYIQLMEYEDIADELDASISTVYRLRKEGINQIG